MLRPIYFFYYFVLIFLTMYTCNATSVNLPFTIYAYIPWKISTSARPQKSMSDYLLIYGIQPINIIYERDYFTNNKIDYKKIKNIALKTALQPNILVSFDLEFGDRFKPETVIPRVQDILNYYRRYNSKAFVGIYATIPQNTYGLKPKGFTYNRLNRPYDNLINHVNFISPSLYNYRNRDVNTWLSNARFNMKQAKKYTPTKPIIPYISPIFRLGPSDKAVNGNLVEELNEDEMTQRLLALYRLGASGCIIWASSQDRTQNGQFPQFNPENGWGKAVVNFIKAHPRSSA